MAITIDRGHDIPVYSEICSFCRNLNPDKTRSCRAFKKEEGIPMAIWLGENDHTEPFPGDHGIQFEKAERP